MSGRRPVAEIIEFNGQEHSIYEWARITGKTAKELRERYVRGWTPEEMLTIPTGGTRRKPNECTGCRYQGSVGAMKCCDYMLMTGHARTVYKGQKVDLCPRRRKVEEKWM